MAGNRAENICWCFFFFLLLLPEPEMSAPVHPTQPAGTSFFQPHSKPRSQTSLIEAAMLSRNKIYMSRKLSPILISLKEKNFHFGRSTCMKPVTPGHWQLPKGLKAFPSNWMSIWVLSITAQQQLALSSAASLPRIMGAFSNPPGMRCDC